MATVNRVAKLAALVVGLWFLAPAALAAIYKCTGADGRVHYTSDPSHCTKAEPQKLEKELQRVLRDDASQRQRRAPRPVARQQGGDGLETMWRGKRPKAERELGDVNKRLGRLKIVVKSCNRGGEWYRTGESGIREHITCKDLHGQYAELQTAREKLASYLTEGLEDECRRAGCQPGWVR